MLRGNLHIVEFDRLTDGECAKLIKWCMTCCFQKWTTNYHKPSYRFIFHDRFDAERFLMTHSEHFNHDLER